jgi:beta-glucoside operon transcriptional antiterminator
MRILRVFNNNVVLASDEDEPDVEVVLTGRGLGFGVSAGDTVDDAKVSRVFRPEDHRDPDHVAALAAEVPLWFVELAGSLTDGMGVPSPTVLALADHLHMAVRRQELSGDGPAQPRHPLQAEVSHLYPEEFATARRMLARVNLRLAEKGTPHLPGPEAVAIALHLVNAGFHTGDLRATYEMTGMFSQLFDVVDSAYGITVDRHSVNAARFITHMRYLFVRVDEGTQLDEGFSTLRDFLAQTHPEAVTCGDRLAAVLELRLGTELSGDERSYLALHVTRLASQS